MTTIGFTGAIGHGKSTSAKYLEKKRNKKSNKQEYVRYAFAEPLKQIAIALKFKYKDVYGSQEEKLRINANWNISGRVLMQKLGTEVFRDILPDVIPDMNIKNGTIWTNIYKIHVRENPKQNMVIEDVRFRNEVEAIKEMNGIIIKIVRNKDTDLCDHISELGIDDEHCDFIIDNNGTENDLFRKIDSIVEQLNK